MQVPAACYAVAMILLQYFHKIANKLNNLKKGLYDMPPQKGKEGPRLPEKPAENTEKKRILQVSEE